MRNPVQDARDRIQLKRDAINLLENKLVFYRSSVWETICKDLESDLEKKLSATMHYDGSDWRELGQRQGRWQELTRILNIPKAIAAEIDKLAAEIATLETQLRPS